MEEAFYELRGLGVFFGKNKMTAIEQMDPSGGHVFFIGYGSRGSERWI